MEAPSGAVQIVVFQQFFVYFEDNFFANCIWIYYWMFDEKISFQKHQNIPIIKIKKLLKANLYFYGTHSLYKSLSYTWLNWFNNHLFGTIAFFLCTYCILLSSSVGFFFFCCGSEMTTRWCLTRQSPDVVFQWPLQSNAIGLCNYCSAKKWPSLN